MIASPVADVLLKRAFARRQSPLLHAAKKPERLTQALARVGAFLGAERGLGLVRAASQRAASSARQPSRRWSAPRPLSMARSPQGPGWPRRSAARHNESDDGRMSRATEESNRRMLRARDTMDRDYAQPLDVPTLARISYVSEAHFIHLSRHLRRDAPPLPAAPACGASDVPAARVGPQRERDLPRCGLRQPRDLRPHLSRDRRESPTAYGRRAADLRAVPACFARAWTRPSSFGEARAAAVD